MGPYEGIAERERYIYISYIHIFIVICVYMISSYMCHMRTSTFVGISM